MNRPNQPSDRAEEIAGNLHGVDLSGGQSTIGRDEMTTGADSIAKAIVGGFAPPPNSPVGQSLLKSWLAWRDRMDRDEALSKEAAEVEAYAHRKGVRKAGKAILDGHPADAAFAKGFSDLQEARRPSRPSGMGPEVRSLIGRLQHRRRSSIAWQLRHANPRELTRDQYVGGTRDAGGRHR